VELLCIYFSSDIRLPSVRQLDATENVITVPITACTSVYHLSYCIQASCRENKRADEGCICAKLVV